MVKCFCDRCGEEIKGTTYYLISIKARDVNPTEDYTVTTSTALTNLNSAMRQAMMPEVQYCEKCKLAIEEFIKGNNI